MKVGIGSMLGILALLVGACTNGGAQGPTAPAAPLLEEPLPTAQYQVTALSGSFQGNFDEALQSFRGTEQRSWRATRGGESWDFTVRTTVELTATETGEWDGTYRIASVEPIEICPARLWANAGLGFGVSMSMTQSGPAVQIVLDFEHGTASFSGTLRGQKLSTTLTELDSYIAECTPL